MKIELHTTPDVFDRLQDEWDSLLDPDRTTDFFMTHTWQHTWWKHLGCGDLAILSVRDPGGSLISIAPWFIAREGKTRFVRTIGCEDVTDYLSILCEQNREEEVFSALLAYLTSQDVFGWDVLNLCNIPQDAPLLSLMPQLAQRCGLPVEVENEDVCPVITLPSTYDQYLEQLDKKQRHELRRKRRRAEEYGVTFEVIGQDDDLELAIDDFFRLMELSTPDKAAFLQVPGHRAFFREIGHRTLKQNILKLLFLTVEGERVAALWQFHYHDRMMLYNSGLNPTAFSALSSGIALLTYSIEDAIARGCRIYDFLQGDEEYKYRMGSAATTVHNLNIWRKPRQQR